MEWNTISAHLIQRYIIYYPHAVFFFFFFFKAMGILLTPPSVYPSVRPSVRPAVRRDECIRVCFKIMDTSVYPSRYLLLNHWAKFYQTCYIISPHSKGVQEQYYFFCASVRLCVRRPSICLSHYLLLNHWAEFNQTCNITSPHGKGVQAQDFFFVRPSSLHLSVTLSPS